MALEDPFEYNSKESFNLLEGNWFDFDLMNNNQTGLYCLDQYREDTPFLLPTQSSVTVDLKQDQGSIPAVAGITPAKSSRRRRQRSRRNQEEIEKQRMTHITVERNRRRQMNEYLSSLRQLMPESYVYRSDQASIIGSAINYVKELEQRLQFLIVAAGRKEEVFRQPSNNSAGSYNSPSGSNSGSSAGNYSPELMDQNATKVEVTVVENHVNLRIRSRKRPKQLLKMVEGLQKLRFTVLHLNLTTVDQMVLYTINLKIEDDCEINSGDEIAAAVNQILSGIE